MDLQFRQAAQEDKGQALIQVTVMLVVILACVALAIDVGRVYAERRHMQNAADAGALAGARELCLGHDDAAAEAAAHEYMDVNGADSTSSIADADGNLVDTIAQTEVVPTIGRAVGWNTTVVAATAQAACGAAKAACGLWPVAFSRTLWQELSTTSEGHCVPRTVVVWNDDKQTPTCVKDGIVHNNICNCYDCDLDDNGKDDFAVVAGAGRAWLDFTGVATPAPDMCKPAGCGFKEMSCQIESNTGARIAIPSCISGDNGVRASAEKSVKTRENDIVSIALYDSIDKCTGDNCPGGHSYQVSSLGCIKVIGWESKFNLKSLISPKDDIKNKKVIMATIDCSGRCNTGCGTTDGRPPVPWEVKAVSLIQ